MSLAARRSPYFFCKSSPEYCWLLFMCPRPAKHGPSLQALNHQVTLGWFIRAMRGWGSNFMVAIVLIHIVQVFLFGAHQMSPAGSWLGDRHISFS